jgi:hypothetical protein
MSQCISRYHYLAFLLAISSFSLLLVTVIALTPRIGQDPLWREQLMGSTLCSLCILGIIAVIFPGKCTRAFHLLEGGSAAKSTANGHNPTQGVESVKVDVRLSVRGHHPDCGNYSAHVLRLGGRRLCASCMGLLFGASVVILATAPYAFGLRQMESGSIAVVFLGTLGVFLGLFQFVLFRKRGNVLRFLFSVFFVLGAFLILVEVDALVRSTTLDLFLTLSALVWILTRMYLSEWDHARICSTCGMMACELRQMWKR